MPTRRHCLVAGAGLLTFWPQQVRAEPAVSRPPTREPFAVASCPFRESMVDPRKPSSLGPKVQRKDFAAQLVDKFQGNKIEP